MQLLPISNLVLSLVVALATVWLSVEAYRTRRRQTAPYVLARIEHDPDAGTLLWLVVENHGKGAAYDLRFATSGDLGVYDHRKLTELDVIRSGLSFLAPSAKYRTFIGAWHELVAASKEAGHENIPDIRVLIRCTSDWKTIVQTESVLAFPEWSRVTPTMEHIRKALERVATALERPRG